MLKLIVVSILILLAHSELFPDIFRPVGPVGPVDPVDPVGPIDPVGPVLPDGSDVPEGPSADPSDPPTAEPAAQTTKLAISAFRPPPPPPCVLDIKCPRNARWTAWFDRDNQSGFGDFETIADLFRQGRGCRRPCWIQCQTVGRIPFFLTGERVHFSNVVGCYCLNSENPPFGCRHDYRIRELC